MGGVHRKGSYFYVIDAFIASIIVVATLIVIFSRHTSNTQSTQAFYTAEDFLSTVESTQLRNYDSQLVRDWIMTGTINDSKRTLLQQLALFEATGNANDNAGKLATALGNSTPANVGIEIILNGNQRYLRSPTAVELADTMLSSKRIVLLRSNATDLYDPVIIEVRTWQ